MRESTDADVAHLDDQDADAGERQRRTLNAYAIAWDICGTAWLVVSAAIFLAARTFSRDLLWALAIAGALVCALTVAEHSALARRARKLRNYPLGVPTSQLFPRPRSVLVGAVVLAGLILAVVAATAA